MFILGDLNTFKNMSATAWTIMIASGFIGVAIPHVMYYIGIKGLGAIIADGLLLATPFATLVLSILFLNEKMTIWQIAGGASIVAGSVLLVIAKGRIDMTRETAQIKSASADKQPAP
jgi:drug/metabolite transporter (DMT)-like permease